MPQAEKLQVVTVINNRQPQCLLVLGVQSVFRTLPTESCQLVNQLLLAVIHVSVTTLTQAYTFMMLLLFTMFWGATTPLNNYVQRMPFTELDKRSIQKTHC